MLVLQPFLQPDLGIVMFKPGKTLLGDLVKMSQGNRLVIMPLPEELVNTPSGKVSNQSLSLGDKLSSDENNLLDGCLIAFFLDVDVQSRLGNFYKWLERIPHCQLFNGEYCDKNLTILDYSEGAIRLCWHHDNEERLNPSDRGRERAKKNVSIWGLEAIKNQLNLNRRPSLHEICWWAVQNGVYEKLPQSIVDKAFGIKQKQSDKCLLKRESDDRDRPDGKSMLNRQMKGIKSAIDKSIRTKLEVDQEPPAMFMARPKEKTWHSERYLKFVRSLPCVITGKTSDVVAHHLIGHGEGKMAGKSHDLFTIPLHTDEHRKFHDDPKAWEAKHDSQLYYVKQTIKKALDLGALF
ncbi:DUF968 domain-containing protein [Vibrio vulnificus]|nr:hypothetical protein SC81_07730 [Vibrio vulnificus]POC08131.1 hypothetical protein CRN54_16570 [Vibrio vulnificus]POC78052.1 hypothetical protein CRN61_17830 [Vibrio vulnificus]RZQ02607.1 DUF968 domain-containing protein [Vibrio vulnificus]